LLIDPFYIPDAKYSGTSTGVRTFEYGSSYVNAGVSLVSLLMAAGWSVVDSFPSVAIQRRPAYYFQTNIGAGTPGEMSPVQCANTMGASWRRASVGSLIYNSYDPYIHTPTCPAGTNVMRWFEAGETTLDTANNLADKITEGGVFSVSVSGIIGDPSAGGSYEFTLIPNVPAFEFDEIPIGIGSPVGSTSLRGYYTLRSPSLNDIYLECKVETRITNNSGGFFAYDGVGTPKLCLTITSSAGGSYYMPLMPGSYYFCGCNYQFAIWPQAGQVASRNANTSMFVSLIEAPDGWHGAGGNCPFVVGANNGDLNIYADHFRTQLHWSQSLACGHSGVMDDTQYLKGTCDGYQTVAMLVRGTKGRPTVSLAGQPLVQAPYIVLPANPTAGPEAEIAGKLWDIVTTSGNAEIGASMMHDGRRWECFSTTRPTGDVGCDMWMLKSAG